MRKDNSGFNSRLLMLRKAAGLSRISASEKSGVPAATIRSWESGNVREINNDSLNKYIDAFASIGHRVTQKWLSHGEGRPSFIDLDIDNHHLMEPLYLVNFYDTIEILKATSNLFYCLDQNEALIYINHSLLSLLGGSALHHQPQTLIHQSSKHGHLIGTGLKELCSEKIYGLCRTNYLEAMNGKIVRFSYIITSDFKKDMVEVGILYYPLVNHSTKKVERVLGFISQESIGI